MYLKLVNDALRNLRVAVFLKQLCNWESTMWNTCSFFIEMWSWMRANVRKKLSFYHLYKRPPFTSFFEQLMVLLGFELIVKRLFMNARYN